MNIYSSDCEVFTFDWIFVFKELESGERTIIHNDTKHLRAFMENKPVVGFFNGKHYDQFILRAILAGADNRMVKEINDYIIDGERGWDHWFIKENRMYLDIFDIRDDMYQGLSLKSIEGHFGLPIEESTVDFTINRPLTSEELEETIKYCCYDVDMTERLIKERVEYLKGKISLAELKDIDPVAALGMTNAKLVAKFLGAKKRERYDEREYVYPKNLDLNYIPKEIVGFFNQMHDESIPSEKLFKQELIYAMDDLEITYGFGGVHAGLKCYIEEGQ